MSPASAKPVKKRRPSFPIYAGDRLNNSALRACSIEARWFLHELECFVHLNGEPYGFVTLKNGRPLKTPDEIATHFTYPRPSIRRWFKEIVTNGLVASDENGVLSLPHMIEAEDEREKWAERQRRKRARAQGQLPPNEEPDDDE